MTLPGMPGSQVSNDGDIMRMISDLQRDMREVKAQNVLATAGITTQPNGITFAGSMIVNGNLSVPNGSITNDALANPIAPGSAGLSVPGSAYNATGADYASQSIAVPAGYTQALVFLGVSGGAINSTATAGYIYVSGSINGGTGGETPQVASAGGYGSASAFAIRTLSGLSGGSITVATHIRTSAGTWAANAANIANTSAIVQFLR